MADVDLDGKGNVLPEKIDKIALIDADTVVFAAAVTLEYFEEVLPRDMYTDEEWDLVLADPGYDEAEGVIYRINLEDAIKHSMDKVEYIMERTGCADFELHFTAGRESFRYTKVDLEYKANRLVDSQGAKTRAPFGLYAIKQALCTKYPEKAKMWIECEADDVVWWYGNKYPEKYIVCAVDKDILGAMKHIAFNYYSSTKYGIDMKFVLPPESPEEYWYRQCLTGDKGDGIIGIHGVGPAKAKKFLYNCKTDAERWDVIVEQYEAAGRTMIEALLNMRMVRLDQYNPETGELVLWDPRSLK